jgi:hypothetical protein
MSAKRYQIMKTDGETGLVTQVGGGSKTIAKAYALRQRMRASRPRGSSDTFSLPCLTTK